MLVHTRYLTAEAVSGLVRINRLGSEVGHWRGRWEGEEALAHLLLLVLAVVAQVTAG